MMGIYTICDLYVQCLINLLHLFQKTQRKVLSNCSAIWMLHFSSHKARTLKDWNSRKAILLYQKLHTYKRGNRPECSACGCEPDDFPRPPGLLLSVEKIEIALKSPRMMGTGFLSVPPSAPCSHPNLCPRAYPPQSDHAPTVRRIHSFSTANRITESTSCHAFPNQLSNPT